MYVALYDFLQAEQLFFLKLFSVAWDFKYLY